VGPLFPYAIREKALLKGYPAFNLLPLPTHLELPQGTISSTVLPHGDGTTLGLVFVERSSGKRFVHYTDCKAVPTAAIDLAKGATAVVLNALRPDPHPSHMSIPEASAVAREIGAPATWLIHLTHLTDHAPAEAELPPGVKLSYDGLRLKL